MIEESSAYSKKEIVKKPVNQMVFEVMDGLPLDLDSLDYETRQWAELNSNTKYLVAKHAETGDVSGFIAIDRKNDSIEAKLLYKFVFPKSRNKGIGKELSLEIYKWARENLVTIINYGINDVIKVDDQGNAKKEIEGPNGTWISYQSIRKVQYENGQYPIDKIWSVICSNGRITLNIKTFVLDKDGNSVFLDHPTLPDNPQDLFQHLLESVFPLNLSKEEIAKKINEPLNTSVFVEGEEVGFMDYMNKYASPVA